ncbi:hydrogenase/urease maturation nickel metallochaperone HypA [Nonomuraea sp. NPDC049504]|uniref:hydrogenase/urease maturation nickel metallochaperone HypA n=1 Tax=Nonomuraea sp. NPDC049504 TaxID=3154729 RepID=UPI00341F64E0
MRGYESGLCAEFVEVIHRQAAGRRVSAVRVRVGARHAVAAETFRQAFCRAARGTAAQDAAVHLVVSPVTIDCDGCGRRTESMDPPLRTPARARAAAGAAGPAPGPSLDELDEPDELDGAYVCPRCAGDRVTVSGGDELALEAVWFRTQAR